MSNNTDSEKVAGGSMDHSPKVDDKPAHIERLEVNRETKDWTRHVVQIRAEKKASGKSGITGVGSDNNGNPGFAAAKDLLPDKVLSAEKLEKKKAPELKEKKLPKDGEMLTLSQLLNDYKTPFIDAYERSKRLKDGEPGKSKTLESVVVRLKACPWADQIRIKFDSHAQNPDYNNAESSITIRPQEPAWKQIDSFAHEGYHATHQTLKELFMDKQPASLPEYLRVKGEAEIASFVTEVKVHNELNSPGIVSYEWNDAEKHKQPAMNLAALYAAKGKDGLANFLLFEAHTKMKISGKIENSNYRDYHASRYSDYVKGHATARKSLIDWFGRDPSVKGKILEGAY